MAIAEAQVDPPYVGLWWRARVGFWRRVGALLIDLAVVLVPLQIVVAVLYVQTNGMVQGSFGLLLTMCSDLERAPEDLQSVLPRIDSARYCRGTLLGFDTSRILIVSQTDQGEANTTTTKSQTFWVSATDEVIDGVVFEADNTAFAILLAYFIGLEWRLGKTIGKHAVGIMVLERAQPERTGIPLSNAILRQAAMLLGFVPYFLIQYIATSVTEIYVALFVAILWAIWIAVSVVRKNDPIYDRLAGTFVILK